MKEKFITIPYLVRNTSLTVALSYVIEMVENVQTISCMVKGPPFYDWLQLRKFEMTSLLESKLYTPLFNDNNNSRNVETAMFIDRAYSDIMKAEKLEIKMFN